MRTSRPHRVGLGAFGSVSIMLALASVAWACTGISPSGSGHYLEVAPNAAPSEQIRGTGVPVTVAGYLVGTCGTACQGKDPASDTALYRSEPITKATGVDQLVIGPAEGVPHASDCGPGQGDVIGTVAWELTGNNVVVRGGGVMQDAQAPGRLGLYRVCAEPDASLLWNYFVVL